MTVTAATYCSREDVKNALDIAETARANDRVDRAIEAAVDAVDGLTHRRFVPWSGTRYFPWPNDGSRTPWRLWLDRDEVVSVSALVSGGETIPSSGYLLEPVNIGPPYTSIEIDLSSRSAYNTGPTYQRDIAVTGVFGHSANEVVVGALGANQLIGATSATTTWSTSRIGVGDLLRIDSERMVVTDRSMVTTGQTLQTPLTAQVNSVTVAVTDGTAFLVDQVLLLDSERMRVVDVAGNNLTVKRSVDGSVLAAHSGSTIYALTGVTLARAQQGTAAAAHSLAATVYRHVVPPLVRDLAIAYAVNQLLSEGAGYARVTGSGDNQREVSGRGLRGLEQDVRERYGRQFRVRAV